jgi:hypothetical protein
MNARFFIGILIGFRPLSDLFDASFCPVPVRPRRRAAAPAPPALTRKPGALRHFTSIIQRRRTDAPRGCARRRRQCPLCRSTYSVGAPMLIS